MTFEEAQEKSIDYAEIVIKNNDRILIENYRKAYNEINKQLRNLYLKMQEEGIPEGEYYNYMTKYNRLERMQLSIYAEYGKAFRANKRILINNSNQVMTDAYYRRLYIINWPIDSDQLFTVLDDRVINQAVLGTAEKWGNLVETYGLKKGYVPQANTLLATLKVNDLKALNKIQTTLTQMFITGQSYTRAAAEFKGLLSDITYNALRIARTEGTRVMNAGALAATNVARSEGIDIVRQWQATLDTNTRQTHARADGQKEDSNGLFHVGGSTGPYPGNMDTARESVNCRCTTIDVIDGVEPELRRARNPLKQKQWDSATAAEKKAGMLADGTPIYGRSQQTDIIGYRDFEGWAKDNGLSWTKKGWL